MRWVLFALVLGSSAPACNGTFGAAPTDNTAADGAQIDGTAGDASVADGSESPAECGDAVCSGAETHASCPSDCGFVHPGVGVGLVQLNFVKEKIARNQEPWKGAYTKMLGSYLMKMSRVPGAVPEVRCAASTGKNYIAAHPELGLSEVGCAEQLDDSAAAYGHALAWYYGGDRAHAQKAVEILNAWSGTLTKIFFDQPRTDMNVQIFANGLHQSGWSGQNFSRAAEIIRHTFNAEAGETAFDAAGFEKMLRDVYLPLTMAGGAGRGSWNGFGVNVNFSMIDATIGIGVFLSDTAVYESGLTTFREHLPSAIYMEGDDTSAYANLAGMPIPPKGTIYDKTNVSASSIAGIWNNPSTFIDGVEGETCRDMSHMAMGFGGMANAAETARLQGADLYGEFQSRLLASLELNAAFINAADAAEALPENWPCPGAINMGGTGYRVGWEIEFNHFAQREGIEMPHVSALVARYRPSGTGLHMNWETLTHAGVP